MKTAKGTECKGKHEFNGKRGMDMWQVYEIGGNRWTVCAHQVGNTHCGALIEVVPDRPVSICCGEH